MSRFDRQSAIHLSKILSVFSAKFVDVQTLSDEELEEFINDMNKHFDDEKFDLNYLIYEMKSFITAVELNSVSKVNH
ncbi:hypothetical protein [Sporosarcina sp. G11-34]|uniref:hypothetical protein n=1 Tax=Sporosarcina sp. G11-34 TaxID=2849605 RepID=UPI0022A91C3C|nr:hypothetical protein [Sporosarcina sp. G11-34]MCZ2258452.1 hypothetical protein [Sporosarcina sp. G11-34]